LQLPCDPIRTAYCGRREDSAEAEIPLVELTRLEYAVLVTVGWAGYGVSGYGVAKYATSVSGGLLGYSRSQIYRAVKVLAKAGYLEAAAPKDEETRAERARVLYVLTDRGMSAVRAWTSTLPALPATGDSELVTRFRASSFLLTGDDVFGDVEEVELRLSHRIEELRDYRKACRRRNDWDDVLQREHELHVSLLEAYLKWLRNVADDFSSRRRSRSEELAYRRALIDDEPDDPEE
jgi:DNA-binding PadR family transcriptional regulator